jgi:hypothetical protein
MVPGVQCRNARLSGKGLRLSVILELSSVCVARTYPIIDSVISRFTGSEEPPNPAYVMIDYHGHHTVWVILRSGNVQRRPNPGANLRVGARDTLQTLELC